MGLLLGVLSTACYETKELRVRIVTPSSALACVDTIDRVATEAGYARAPVMSGPSMFYVPKMGPATPSPAALGWGVGVWLQPHGEHGETDRCAFELEALGLDPAAASCARSPTSAAPTSTKPSTTSPAG
jgi:hypothetical protein